MLRSPAKAVSQPDLPSLNLEEDNVNCRKRKQPEQEFVTPAMFEAFMLRMEHSLKDINTNINDGVKVELSKLSATTTEIKSDLNSLRQENAELKRSLAEMYSQQHETVALISDLRTSLDFTSNRVDILSQRVDKYEQHRKHDEELTIELEATKQALRNIEIDLNRQQQRERLLNLEITGIPEAKNESLQAIFLSVANHSGVTLTSEDIVHINRVQPKQIVKGRPRSIVVKLKNRVLKDNIIAGVRKRRGITTRDINIPGDSKPIYVNEHLTSQNKMLFKMCREAATAKMIKYVWIRNCSIFMRKNETSPAVLINTEEDLKRFR